MAQALSASVSSVFRWAQTYRTQGWRALRPRPTPGRPPKLSESQKRKLVEVLLKGPLAAGYRTDLWTLQRVAEVIDRQFGIQYHPCHVWKLLTGLGWSCQKPERRALQRDEAAIERWTKADSCSSPNVRSTWAPKGRTPCVHHLYKQDRISVIAALAVFSKRRRLALYLHCRTRNLTGLDVRAFLQHLLKHLRGLGILLWDQGPIHTRKEVQRFRWQHPRLHVHCFPAYAPELNSAECVWSQADRALANGAPEDLAALRRDLRSAVRRIRGSQQLLWSCIYALRPTMAVSFSPITYANINNAKIKFREKFRPFAPSILEEALHEYFVGAVPDPFVIQVYSVRPDKRRVIPAVTHVDGSGRLQTVNHQTNPLYWRLLKAFERLTGVPVLLNTSFNENEPIVHRPGGALDCFLRTQMDTLVLGRRVIEKGGSGKRDKGSATWTAG